METIENQASNAAKAKHTPGPWKLERQRRNHWAILCDSSLLNEVRRTEIIAEINDPVGYMPAEENLANARLIAAAPDLLEAASEAMAALDAVSPGDHRKMKALSLLRAAIAKAEGSTAADPAR